MEMSFNLWQTYILLLPLPTWASSTRPAPAGNLGDISADRMMCSTEQSQVRP